MKKKTVKKPAKRNIIQLPHLKSLKVTAEDIRKGIPKSPDYCPIAYALRREFAGFEIEDVEVNDNEPSVTILLPSSIVQVGKTMIDDVRRRVYFYFNLPDEANEFIEKFDEGRSNVKPTSFAVIDQEAEIRQA